MHSKISIIYICHSKCVESEWLALNAPAINRHYSLTISLTDTVIN